MSKLEEYRRLIPEIETQYVMEYADAAIAELEAENSNIREAEREGDRVLSAWVSRAEQAEAELVTLNASLQDMSAGWRAQSGHSGGMRWAADDIDELLAERSET